MTLKTLQNMRIDKVSNLFYECISVNSSKNPFIPNTALYSHQKHPNYKSLDSSFQVDGKSMGSEGHSNLPKDDFRVRYFTALDLIMASISTRFDQPNL